MLKLKIINYQTNQIDEISLAPGECLIGRHPSCDLVLDSPEISRVHGRIIWHEDNCYFSDLGSTDGSRVNHEAIAINQKYPLHADDMIRLGEYVIWVESITATHSHTPAAKSSFIPQWKQGELMVKCVQIIEQTHDVKTFRLMADKPLLFFYKPGQFVTLELEIAGKKVLRSYSISSSPSRPLTLDITVKRVTNPDGLAYPPGLASNWLHDHLHVGSRVKLRGPSGQFTCVHSGVPTRKILMLSAGSGITPMMSMAQWLCDTTAATDIVFFHSAARPQDIIFRAELEAMSARYANFKLAVTVTRPEPTDRWSGLQGRLSRDLLRTIAPDVGDRTVYVCGSAPFMKDTKALLMDLGFPMEHYYEESFGGYKPRKDPTPQSIPQSSPPSSPKSSPETQPQVVFAHSGKEVNCDGEEVILEVAEMAGISLPSGCRMGACGACKQKMVTGNVKYISQPDALKTEDQQAGMILTCVACPVGKVVINA